MKDRVCIDCQSKFAAPNRNICYSCKSRRYKRNNPYKYAFRKLKYNAERRGKEFELTLDVFKEFCAETEYMVGKGRSAVSLHIDRIDPEQGYTKDNIQALTNAENVKKHLNWSYNYHQRRCEFWVSTAPAVQEPDDDSCPF